jgi:Phage integrase family
MSILRRSASTTRCGAQGTASVRVLGGAGSARWGDRTVVRPMILFAAATGPRPAEWIALEKRDIDREERVVYVRRSFTRRRAEDPENGGEHASRATQARALDALDRIKTSDGSPLLFPGERAGYLDIHHSRPFQWRPAQQAAGIDPLRRVYDLRHTFATFALRAGISTFDLSRYMGASLTMIDRHYGHLAHDRRERAIKLLDALNAPWTPVDAAWTSREQPASALKTEATAEQGERGSPLTDSNRRPLLTILGSRQPVATHSNGFRLIHAFFGRVPFATGCHRLRPLGSF